jgi:hypothetical protein
MSLIVGRSAGSNDQHASRRVLTLDLIVRRVASVDPDGLIPCCMSRITWASRMRCPYGILLVRSFHCQVSIRTRKSGHIYLKCGAPERPDIGRQRRGFLFTLQKLRRLPPDWTHIWVGKRKARRSPKVFNDLGKAKIAENSATLIGNENVVLFRVQPLL